MQPIYVNGNGKHQFRLNVMYVTNGVDYLSESRKNYLDNVGAFIDDDPYRYECAIFYFEIGIKKWFSNFEWKRIREHYPLGKLIRDDDGVATRQLYTHLMEFRNLDGALDYWEKFVVQEKNYKFWYC